jgi:hypothetical protein
MVEAILENGGMLSRFEWASPILALALLVCQLCSKHGGLLTGQNSVCNWIR